MMGATLSASAPAEEQMKAIPTSQPSQWVYHGGRAIASLSSVSRVAMVVFNDTPYTLEMLWLNYNGTPTSYGQLQAGKKIQISTYHTHPWVYVVVDKPELTPFLMAKETQKQVLFPNAARPEYHLQMAPTLTWTPALHASHFKQFAAFTEQVKSLLLTHERLYKQGPDAFWADEPASPEMPARRSMSACVTTALKCLPRAVSAPGRPSASMEATFVNTFGAISACRQAVERGLGLRDLPLDVLLLIIQHMAPDVPDLQPTLEADMVLPPESLMAEHEAAMVMIQQQLQQQAQQQAQQAGQPQQLAAQPVAQPAAAQ